MKFVMNHLHFRTLLMRSISLVLFVGFTAAISSHAQDSSARIEGSVADPTHALIPKASLKLTDRDKNQSIYFGITDASGHFLIPQVPVGNYYLEVNAKGFSQTVLTDIVATVGQVISLKIVLSPGVAADSVTVSGADQELLEKATSGISTLVTPSQVDDLPLPNRDVTNLLANIAGVSYGGDSTSLNTSQLSINGSRTLNTEVLLDGMSIMDNVTGGFPPLPSPDALAEFRFSTLNAPAEFGRTSGAVMQIVSRSGTNDFHVRLYELFRNENLNANGYFNNLNNIARQPNRYNQYGAVILGPLYIPKLYNGRNKSFFMINYDHTLHVTPNTNIETTPPAAFRTGDFSSATALIHDPATGDAAIFPGNIIPANRLDPAAVKIMNLLPGGNNAGTPEGGDLTQSNYFQNQPYKTPSSRYTLRLDQAVGDKMRFFAMAERYLNPGNTPLIFVPILDPNPGKDNGGGWVATVGYTHVWSPRLITDIRYGFTDQHDDHNPVAKAASIADLQGILGISSLPENVTPYISINGYTAFGAASQEPVNNDSMTFMFSSSATIMLGKHTLKSGIGVRWDEYNVLTPHSTPNGSFQFYGDISNPSHTRYAGAYAMADFMMGYISGAAYEINEPRTGRRTQNYSVFVEDDWRALPKLTLNLGLRYEYETPIYLNNNLYSRFDLTTGNLLAAGLNANKYLNLKTPKLDFMPRVGFAYAVTNNTVIRGAFGTFYSPLLGDLGGGDNFPGYDGGSGYGEPGIGKPLSFSLSQGIPLNGIQVLTNPFAALAGSSPSNPFASYGQNFGPISSIAHMEERNLGIQQKLPGSIVIEANYVGNHGLHLPMSLSMNSPPMNMQDAVALMGSTSYTQSAMPFPNIGGLTGLYFIGNSNYNSLQASIRRQFSSRVALTSNFTWAHSIDDASGVFSFSQPNGLQQGQFPQIPSLRRTDRSNTSFDVRKNLNVALQLGSASRHRILDGWKMSPVLVFRSGMPLNVSQTNQLNGAASQRPNGNTSRLKIHPYKNGTYIQYFMPLGSPDFPLTPSGPLVATPSSGNSCPAGTTIPSISTTACLIVPAGIGNVGRFSLRGPGEVNMNLSLQRLFRLKGKATFQFRVDAFNAFNHTNFNSPSTTGLQATVATSGSSMTPTFGGSFGEISSNRTPRYLQLVAKLAF